MTDFNNDIPKHIKKKESSVSKSKAKSKHKHEYVDCLLVEENGYPRKGTYCKICGKIGKFNFFEIEPENGHWRMLDTDEIFEKYKDLEKVYVNDIWQKYVALDNETEEGESDG